MTSGRRCSTASPKENISEPQPHQWPQAPLCTSSLLENLHASPTSSELLSPCSAPPGRMVMVTLQTPVVLSTRGKAAGSAAGSSALTPTPNHKSGWQRARQGSSQRAQVAQQGTFHIHSASSMAVPRGQPRAAGCLAHTICCLSGQGSSQLMENSDMSNLIVFVQLGLKSNSTETLGWP